MERFPDRPESLVLTAYGPVAPAKAVTAPAEVTAMTPSPGAPRLTSLPAGTGRDAARLPKGPPHLGRLDDSAKVDRVPGASVALTEPWLATSPGSTSSEPGTDSHLHLTNTSDAAPGRHRR
ncbi:hypothetical protein ACFQX6_55845 [Streptosporangium lutulentum]